jgi:hypothetical protein
MIKSKFEERQETIRLAEERKHIIRQAREERAVLEHQLEVSSYELLRKLEDIFNLACSMVRGQIKANEQFEDKYIWEACILEGPAVIVVWNILRFMKRMETEQDLLIRAKVDIRLWQNRGGIESQVGSRKTTAYDGPDPDYLQRAEASEQLKVLRRKDIANAKPLLDKLKELKGLASNVTAATQAQCMAADKRNPVLREIGYRTGYSSTISGTIDVLIRQSEAYIQSWSQG